MRLPSRLHLRGAVRRRYGVEYYDARADRHINVRAITGGRWRGPLHAAVNLAALCDTERTTPMIVPLPTLRERFRSWLAELAKRNAPL